MSRDLAAWTWRIRDVNSISFLLSCLTETPSVCMQRRRSFIWTAPPGCRPIINDRPSPRRLRRRNQLSNEVHPSEHFLFLFWFLFLFSFFFFLFFLVSSLAPAKKLTNKLFSFSSFTPRPPFKRTLVFIYLIFAFSFHFPTQEINPHTTHESTTMLMEIGANSGSLLR